MFPLPLSLPLLLSFTLSQKPIILIPGMMASPLNGSVDSAAFWYCPQTRNGTFWVDDTLVLPPLFNCLADWIRLIWNPASQDIEQLPYSHLGTWPIGSVDGITSVDTLFGFHLLPTYQDLVNRLLNLGYVKEFDLFGIPYDWRFGLYHKQAFWDRVIQLIESAVTANSQKAVLIGHSMGGMFIHHFLSNITTAEWRSKYIESTVLLAPSIAGSGAAYGSLWTKEMPWLSILGKYPETVNGLGGIHIHMHNAVIFQEVTVYIDDNGREFKGSEIVSIIKNNGKVPGDYEHIFDLYTPWFRNAPAALDVPVALAYNTGLGTVLAIDRSSGDDEFVYGRGDMIVNAEGVEYICEHWKGPTPVLCFDLRSDGLNSDHITMLWNSVILDFAVDHAINSTWTTAI